MKIAFHTPNLNFRGSCVALYDYAHYNELLLGNQSIIVTDLSQHSSSDPIAIEWIRRRFPIRFYRTKEDLLDILKEETCHLLYCIKYGTNDGICFSHFPTVIHCVFDMTQPHGDVYAGVSRTLANKFGSSLYVPHMISLIPRTNNTLRQSLDIPESAIVFGRHGGQDTFNLEFAKRVISRLVRETDIHFVFLNAPQWDIHAQIHYLPATTDKERKELFINTCDAMIVPETMGHTFGMSIAEFSIRCKPIICYNGTVWNKTHLDILGDDGIYFENEQQLYTLLKEFVKTTRPNAYQTYTPSHVMSRFFNVFLKDRID